MEYIPTSLSEDTIVDDDLLALREEWHSILREYRRGDCSERGNLALASDYRMDPQRRKSMRKYTFSTKFR